MKDDRVIREIVGKEYNRFVKMSQEYDALFLKHVALDGMLPQVALLALNVEVRNQEAKYRMTVRDNESILTRIHATADDVSADMMRQFVDTLASVPEGKKFLERMQGTTKA